MTTTPQKRSRLPSRLAATALIAVIVTGTAALTACAKRASRVTDATAAQTLLIGNAAEPADLDPPTVTAYTDMNVVMALFEGLTFIDEQTMRPVPAAAERWDVSPDGLTWTFHLRRNAAWSNGDPVVAGDFVASFRRTVSPALALENASYLFALKNAEAINAGKAPAAISSDLATPEGLGCTAKDDHTLILTLERPTPHLALLTGLTPWYPVNPRVLAKFGAMERRGTAWTRAENLVGNGAFRLVEWSPNSRIVVERNPRHWGSAQATLKRIEFFPIEKADTEERNFRAGQLHVTYSLPVAKVAAWRTRDPARLRIDPFLQTVFVSFNTKQPPFDDARIRQAFSMAIDRAALVRATLAGSRPPASSATPPNTGGYTARARVEFDAGKARELLAAAGFPGGKGFPAVTLQVRNDDVQPVVAEALQAMWKQTLGVDVRVSPMEQKTWLQNQSSLDYSLSTYSWTGDFPDPLTFLANFTSSSGNNWLGWSDTKYDALVNEAATLADPQRRHELLQEAEALLLNAVPTTPLYHGVQTYLLDPRVEGWVPAILGSRRYQLVHLRQDG